MDQVPAAPPGEPALPGDSSVQREAEILLIDALGRELGVGLSKNRRKTVHGSVVEFDGLSVDPPILVEAWAHQGKPLSAQKYKVMTEALKLVWAESTFFPDGARKILVLADDAAAAHFRGTSWMAAALLHLGIEVRVVTLPDEIRERIRLAQVRQFR